MQACLVEYYSLYLPNQFTDFVIFHIFYSFRRRRKYEKSTPDIHNGEEKLMNLKDVDEGRKKQRDSYIGHGDLFEKFKYIDEDMDDNTFT